MPMVRLLPSLVDEVDLLATDLDDADELAALQRDHQQLIALAESIRAMAVLLRCPEISIVLEACPISAPISVTSCQASPARSLEPLLLDCLRKNELLTNVDLETQLMNVLDQATFQERIPSASTFEIALPLLANWLLATVRNADDGAERPEAHRKGVIGFYLLHEGVRRFSEQLSGRRDLQPLWLQITATLRLFVTCAQLDPSTIAAGTALIQFITTHFFHIPT